MKLKHFSTKVFIRISLLITAFILIFSFIILREFFTNYKSSLYNNFKNEFIARVNKMDVILEIVNGETKYNIAHIEGILSNNDNTLNEENLDKIESNIKERLKNTKYFDSVSYIYLGDSFDDWKGNWFVETSDMQIKEEGPYDNQFIKTYFDNTTEYDLIKSNLDIDNVWNYVNEEDLDVNILGNEFSTAVISNIHVLRDQYGNPIAYITCDVSGRQFKEIMSNINFNSYGEVQLLDEKNDLLIKTSEEESELKISKNLITDKDTSEMMQSGEFYYIHKSLTNGWKVLFVADRKDIFASYYSLIKLVSIVLAIFIFITFYVSYVLGKNISKPVNLLVDDVTRFNIRDASITISPESLDFADEIGTLANVLKEMQEQIANDYKIIHNNTINLESVVESKTKELTSTNQMLQELLAHSNDQKKELQTLNLKLTDSIERAKLAQDSLVESRKIAALSTVVVGVAHEINTPIGTCYTSITFLKQKLLDFKEKYDDKSLTKADFENFINILSETIDLIITGTTSAIELIESFKQLSNIDENLVYQKFKIRTLLKYLVEGLGLKLGSEVNIMCDENLEFMSYPLIFSQIFNNLLMNSMQHGYGTNGQLEIDINVKEETDSLLIMFNDNGPGMTEDTLEKIFDPFFTTRRGYGNVGLGLNIVYNLIVSKLKGTIKIDSKLNEGTVCEIRLPITNKIE